MTTFLAHLAALFTVSVWGVTFISTKILLTEIPAEEILFTRFLLGWIFLWLLKPARLPIPDRTTILIYAGAGFFGITLYFLLENIALEYSYASNVGVIVSTTPFFTAIVGWLLFDGARPGWRFYIGCLISFTGIYLVSFQNNSLHFSPLGDTLALLAAITWAFYSNLTKRLAAQNNDSLRVTRGIFFCGLLLMLPILAFTGLPAGLAILAKPVNLCNLLFLGIVASALCFATWTYCLHKLGEAQASAYIYLVPVVTIFAAAIWLDEKIDSWMLAGAALTITGLLIAEYRPHKRH